MNELKSLHDQKIDSVAKDLSQKGYQVIIEPLRNDLPFELGNYRPDLIALKGNEGIILEVKTTSQRLSIDRFQEISERIAEHKGWQFFLITLDDITEEVLPDRTEALPSWDALQAKIEAISVLIRQAMIEPAVLYLWSAIEAILRKRAIAQKIPIDRFPPAKLLNHMYSSGEISLHEFDTLMPIYKKRNRIAHGLMTALVTEELEHPLAITRALTERWQASPE